jgi:hypothetical protein
MTVNRILFFIEGTSVSATPPLLRGKIKAIYSFLCSSIDTLTFSIFACLAASSTLTK